MASVGFASWSFASQTEVFTIQAEADNIYIDPTVTDLSYFGISVSGTTASVEHYKYSVYEDVYVLDSDGNPTYADDDSEKENPLTEPSYVEHDCYGDLTIHSDISVNLTSGTSTGYETINTISYDDPTYTYLKIGITLNGNLLRITLKDPTLRLSLFPQYVIIPECVASAFTGIYTYYIPVKSISTMSIYTMALIDNISEASAVPFDLDFTYDLSETWYDNTNYIYQIGMDFSIISEADYQSEINGGGNRGR